MDVTLAYPDRRSGALEVTSHAGDGVQRRDAVLAREEYKWPNPGSWVWFVRFGTAAPIPEMRSRYARIIDLCERAGVGRPEHLPWATQSTDPDLRWLVEYSDMTMRGTPTHGTTTPGPVWVLPEFFGGFLDEQLVGLPAAVKDLLQVDHIARHVPKLLAHPADEHHLFVNIKHGGLPESQYMVLVREVQVLPPTVPSLPDGLSHLWLSTGYGPSVLYCTPSGWSEHRVFDV